MLERITQLVNSVITQTGAEPLTGQQVIELIGERAPRPPRPRPACGVGRPRARPPRRSRLDAPPRTLPQTWARRRAARRGATGCWTPSTARAALWGCASTQCAWACCRTASSSSACWAAPTCRAARCRTTTAAQVGAARGGAAGVPCRQRRPLGRPASAAGLRRAAAVAGAWPRSYPAPTRPRPLPAPAAAASRSGDAGRGCLFMAHRGRGAYAAALWDAAGPVERIHVDDVPEASGARFMESFESRHSDHSFTAQVVHGGGGGGRQAAWGVRAPRLRSHGGSSSLRPACAQTGPSLPPPPHPPCVPPLAARRPRRWASPSRRCAWTAR
jgi:hypothetical protein